MRIPIQAPIRGIDKYGSGAFLAPRGSHEHRGVDVACYPGSYVPSAVSGKFTKLGYPYDPNNSVKGHLRYVQITDAEGRNFRYFYVCPLPSMEVGADITAGEIIGYTQGLNDIYPGITDHFHFEIMTMEDGGKVYHNPEEYYA